MKYIAEIKLSKKARSIERIEVNLDKKIEDTLMDDVEDLVYKKMDEDYPESECPDAFIYRMFVEDLDGTFPVISESDKDSEKEISNSKKYKKYLVLPEAQYSLTPECELWLKLKDAGIIPENTPFNYEKYHKIIKKDKKN